MARTLEERLFGRTKAVDGCLRWLGAHTPKGYGQLREAGQAQAVHRLAYRLLVGPIPEGYEVDHLCMVRDCINPRHLEAVTQRENKRRQGSTRTECTNGHPYSDENTLLGPRGWRRCRTCKNTNQRAYKARRRAMEPADG